CVIEPDDLDGERAAEAREPAAERKSDGEHAIDVDAEPARHALVVDRGAHLRAEAGVFERRDQRRRDHDRHADQEQPVYAETLAPDRDGPAHTPLPGAPVIRGASGPSPRRPRADTTAGSGAAGWCRRYRPPPPPKRRRCRSSAGTDRGHSHDRAADRARARTRRSPRPPTE